MIVVETNDLFGGGIGDRHHQSVENLRNRLRFGKWVGLTKDPCEYGRRTLKQGPTYDVNISMVWYFKDRAREVMLEKGCAKTPITDCNTAEIFTLRGLLGKHHWATREGLPCGVGDSSLLHATMPNPKTRHVEEANATQRRLWKIEATISIKPVPTDRIQLCTRTPVWETSKEETRNWRA